MTIAENMQLNKTAGSQVSKTAQGADSQTLHNQDKSKKRQHSTTLTLIYPPQKFRSNNSSSSSSSSQVHAQPEWWRAVPLAQHVWWATGKQETSNISTTTQPEDIWFHCWPSSNSGNSYGPPLHHRVRNNRFRCLASKQTKTLPLGKGRGAQQTKFCCFSDCQSEAVS